MLIKFQNSVGVERIIGEGDTKEKCNQIIQKFLKDRGYKSYYWNMHKINGRLRVDVGSWTEFFFVEGSEEELNEYFC